MAKCNCAGSTCGCRVTAGAGITVGGTGTAVDPFVVRRNTATDSVGAQVQVSDTTTVDMTKIGTGTAADPIILSAAVVLVAPNGSRWSLAISNAGVLSTVAL